MEELVDTMFKSFFQGLQVYSWELKIIHMQNEKVTQTVKLQDS
jgi:hypothetical protein